MAIPRNLSNLAQGADTSGVLGPTKGGTGLSSVGATGNVLTSNGSAWVSSAPSGVPVGALQYFSSSAIPDSSWLACNGTIYSDSSYPSLSTAIGNIPNRTTSSQNATIFNSGGFSIYSIKVVVGTSDTYYAAGSYDFDGTTLRYASKSTNGASWSGTNLTGPGLGLYDLQFFNSLFFAIITADSGGGSDQLRTSTNFDGWTTRTTNATATLRTVRYLNSIYVAAGDSGNLTTSTDADTWTLQTTGTSSAIYGVAYGNGVYVFVGAGGVCRSSTNLTSWTTRTSNTSNDLLNLIFANGKFYAIGTNVTCISTDGITWTAYPTLFTPSVNSVIFGYGNNFYASFGSRTYWSADGINWGVYVASGNAITSKTSELLVAFISGTVVNGATYNPFTYTTSTQFAVPTQPAKPSNQTGVTVDGNFNLYIKAT